MRDSLILVKDIENIRPHLGYKVIKRLFDIIISLVGCLVLIPVTMIIKLVSVMSGDYESIFYTQKRIGKDGKEFVIYKYRSMIPNADEVLEKYLKKHKKVAKEYKLNKKLKNDPRITKIGNFIRKTSIDELPQFFNVLKNDMSFIGNRPYLPREKEDMGIYYQEIIKTKPAMTGLWQTSGRSETTFDERLKLESFYSTTCNLKMDIKIFLKTFLVVLLKKGAK